LRRPATTVRGIVRQGLRTARVFLFDETDFATSVAVDLPLLDSADEQIPHIRNVDMLRQLTGSRFADHRPVADMVVEGQTIPVYDAAVMANTPPPATLQTQVHTTLLGLTGGPRNPGDLTPSADLTFAGFLILSPTTVRYYLDLVGGQMTIGIDVPLVGQDGNIRGSGASFPDIKLQELFGTGTINRLERPGVRDDYCGIVYDMSGWM
jgi:hypothetical protein